MRILLIGATGFIGSQVLRELAGLGHEICVFHRGVTRPPVAVDEIIGDRNDLPLHAGKFRSFRPDAVVDFVLSDGRQARQLVEVFRGVTRRMVAISSGDVYRAVGILHGAEQGPVQPVPLTEESDLRTVSKFYPPESVAQLKALFPWVTPDYDKIPVERAIMSNSDLPGTVLRLPFVFGPRDPLHRLFPYLKRMDDRRPAILLQDDIAAWRGSRGYVENVAAAIALATVSDRAAGTIYNVAERETLCEADWVRIIGSMVGWNGTVVPFSKDTIPPHLRMPYRNEQHWEMSSARIRNELGFQEPVDFTTALERTIAWERTHPPGPIDPKQFDYAAEDAALRGAAS
ncbi:MAG TPA: NAD-dependent epimerase/dehydratase family protein [Bryobacteraceae bacterium]